MKTSGRIHPRNMGRELGSVLILSLIMLMALTLLALSAIKMGTVSLRAVNNLQTRAEAMAAADAAISTVLSGSLTQASGAPIAAQTISVAGMTVQVTKPCVRGIANIPNGDLPSVFTSYAAECQSGKPIAEQQSYCRCLSASEYKANDLSQSNCYRLTWDIAATAQNNWFGANATVTQGISTQHSSSSYYSVISTASNFCS